MEAGKEPPSEKRHIESRKASWRERPLGRALTPVWASQGRQLSKQRLKKKKKTSVGHEEVGPDQPSAIIELISGDHDP